MFKRSFPSITVAICLAFLLSAGVLGQRGEKGISRISNDGGSVSWQMLVPHESVTLTVSTPDGSVFSREFKSGANPVFTPTNEDGEFYGDGTFAYQLVLTPVISPDVKAQMAAARKQGKSDALASEFRKRGDLPSITSESGSFALINGQIFTANEATVEPEPLRSETRTAEPDKKTETTGKAASGGTESLGGDFVINQDLIVDGSACIGFDCANGLAFGFDTLILKENNLRLFFDDTSTSLSFPRNDWRLVANESANGGLAKFTVEDVTAGRNVFTIEAGADSNAIYVDTGGRTGFSTNTPAVELHVRDGDTPTLRLEQDGSAGFNPQTWDVAGNETNFFVRDVTNGSQLPLRIRPDAPTNSIFVDTDGDVGLGTGSPDSNLDIEAPRPEFRLTGTDSGQQWEQKMNGVGNLNFQSVVTGNNVLQLSPTGNASLLQLGLTANNRVDITGSLFINGVDNSSPDYVFEPDFALLSIEDHAKFMWSNKHLPAVGKSLDGDDGKGVINVGARSQGVLEELETAHIYIEQLDKRLKKLEQQNEALDDREQEISKLKAEVEALKTLVKSLIDK